MNILNTDILRKLWDSANAIWSIHAMERLQERGVIKPDVYNVIRQEKNH